MTRLLLLAALAALAYLLRPRYVPARTDWWWTWPPPVERPEPVVYPVTSARITNEPTWDPDSDWLFV